MRNNHGRKERAPFQFCLPTTEPEFPLIVFHLHKPPVVTWGAVKGAPGQGAFILTLDSSPRHLQSSWERSATQFSWASFLSGFGFQFVRARLPQCFRTVCLDHSPSFTEVH